MKASIASQTRTCGLLHRSAGVGSPRRSSPPSPRLLRFLRWSISEQSGRGGLQVAAGKLQARRDGTSTGDTSRRASCAGLGLSHRHNIGCCPRAIDQRWYTTTTRERSLPSGVAALALTRNPFRGTHLRTSHSQEQRRRVWNGMSDMWRRWALRRLRNRQQKVLEDLQVSSRGHGVVHESFDGEDPSSILQSSNGSCRGDFASDSNAYAPLGNFLGDEGASPSMVDSGNCLARGTASEQARLRAKHSARGGWNKQASLLADSLRKGPHRMKEMKLRCTEFNARGEVMVVSGEFQKQELIAKFGLLPRDLRKIDSSTLPTILVRPSAILLSLLHLRVLIMYNRVLVFDAFGTSDSFNQSVFIYDLEHRLAHPGDAGSMNGTSSGDIGGDGRSTNQTSDSDVEKTGGTTNGNGSIYEPAPLPYEFRALEAVLLSVTSGLENEFEGVRRPVTRVLRELEEDIDRDKLRHLLVWSKKLGTFEQKARLVRDALEELLEADDDLAAMYLSDKARGEARVEDEHTEVEMLLESYHKVADGIVQAAENLVGSIRNTEEIVKAILDANRNSLMLLELKFSIGTLGLGAGTFVAALYGMNLKNFFEESDLAFTSVSVACGVLTGIVCIASLSKLRRVQRISMWGERTGVGGAGGRGSWMKLGGTAQAQMVDAVEEGAGSVAKVPKVPGGSVGVPKMSQPVMPSSRVLS